jgi:ATP-binding cassette subfamily D (ALD) protein 2
MFSVRSRRAKILLLSSSFALITYVIRRYRRYLILKKRRSITSRREETPPNDNGSPTIRKALNKRFFHQIRELLRILIPSIRSDSFVILITHLTTLMTRTFLSVYIAHLDGAIVKSLVQRNSLDFIRAISIFIAVAVPASFINSFIRFAEAKLALAFRTKLTHHAYEAYFHVSFPIELMNEFHSNFYLESNLFSSIEFR